MAGPDEEPGLPRYSLRGWLGKVRGRRWLRLFVFEFFVILLGVLAAQALQNWFAERAERRSAVMARATLDRNLDSLGRSAEIRMRDALCNRYRLAAIQQAILERRTPTISLAPPDEALVVDFGWSAEVAALLREHFGDEVVDRYANIALWEDALRRAQAEEQRSWAGIGRLSPAFGSPTAEDYSLAKSSMISAYQDLRRVGYATGNIARKLEQAGIEPDMSELEQMKGAREPCQAATGYSLDEHREAAERGELVTGEKFSEVGGT